MKIKQDLFSNYQFLEYKETHKIYKKIINESSSLPKDLKKIIPKDEDLTHFNVIKRSWEKLKVRFKCFASSEYRKKNEDAIKKIVEAVNAVLNPKETAHPKQTTSAEPTGKAEEIKPQPAQPMQQQAQVPPSEAHHNEPATGDAEEAKDEQPQIEEIGSQVQDQPEVEVIVFDEEKSDKAAPPAPPPMPKSKPMIKKTAAFAAGLVKNNLKPIAAKPAAAIKDQVDVMKNQAQKLAQKMEEKAAFIKNAVVPSNEEDDQWEDKIAFAACLNVLGLANLKEKLSPFAKLFDKQSVQNAVEKLSKVVRFAGDPLTMDGMDPPKKPELIIDGDLKEKDVVDYADRLLAYYESLKAYNLEAEKEIQAKKGKIAIEEAELKKQMLEAAPPKEQSQIEKNQPQKKEAEFPAPEKSDLLAKLAKIKKANEMEDD